jgi:hypothetical protein
MTAAHWSATMTVPHYIGEDKSDMLGIKRGWYAIRMTATSNIGPTTDSFEIAKFPNPSRFLMKP